MPTRRDCFKAAAVAAAGAMGVTPAESNYVVLEPRREESLADYWYRPAVQLSQSDLEDIERMRRELGVPASNFVLPIRHAYCN